MLPKSLLMRTQLCYPFGGAPPDKGLLITAVMQKNPPKSKKKNAFYLLSVLKKEGDVSSYCLGQLLGSLLHALAPAQFPSFLYVTGLLPSMGSQSRMRRSD